MKEGGFRMRLVQINNSSETFTSTASGAIATHIWEVSRRCDAQHLVISQAALEPAFSGVDVEYVPAWPKRVPGWREWRRRAIRRVIGWRESEQWSHAKNVLRVLRRHGINKGTLLLHNDPEMAVFLKKHCPGVRVVHHFHNPVVAKPRIRRRFRDSADAVTAVSQYVAVEIQKIYGMMPVKVIHNGVDLESFKPVTHEHTNRITLNFLGRTGIEKGPDILLRAALRLALEGVPLGVQMIGSNHWGRWEADAYQSELGNLYDELSRAGASVHVTGHLARERVPSQLMQADVHVVPSRWEEPCALSLLEGMAAGLAVVASRTGGTPEILGEAGFLFSKDSVDELTAHLRRLILDDTLRRSMASKARQRAQCFTWEKCWEEFSEVLF
jgi:glycosyltransferase involved in cell wall biosynthesis